ncbi:unnamed protein product [Bemisia tabaci]|uniref:Uncharacterized protein n=1 Tax=Bemisia tabaci TaxID=7038 RepID=A0A9P0APE9_BEMTA|nr:unnamed protein product [Bemisia tabaci]
MEAAEQFLTALDAQEQSGLCATLKPGAGEACRQAFAKLDMSGYNVCPNWSAAGCYLVSNPNTSTQIYKCAAYVPNPPSVAYSSSGAYAPSGAYRTFEDCAPDLPKESAVVPAPASAPAPAPASTPAPAPAAYTGGGYSFMSGCPWGAQTSGEGTQDSRKRPWGWSRLTSSDITKDKEKEKEKDKDKDKEKDKHKEKEKEKEKEKHKNKEKEKEKHKNKEKEKHKNKEKEKHKFRVKDKDKD